jgi:hypothetical protein
VQAILNPPKQSFEARAFSFNVPLTNIKKIELYPIIITPSGKEVTSEAPTSVYTFK